MNNIDELIIKAIIIGLVVATFLLNTGRVQKAIDLCKENLFLLNIEALSIEQQFRKLLYRVIYEIMFYSHCRIHDNTSAITYGRKLLFIYRECSETVSEGRLSIHLARLYKSQNKYVEAKELNERAITIMRESRDKRGEANSYGNLGIVFRSLGDYVKAKEYHEKALAISMKIDYREGEATACGNLGTVFQSLGDYVKAKEYYEKALAISMKIDDREGEATACDTLGTVFHSLGDYVKAKEYLEKALAISMKIDHREGEATACGNLGTVFHSLGDYVKAKEYYEKALAISMKIGSRAGEATACGNLGNVCQLLGDYVKAKEYHEKALAINIKIGHKAGEAADCGNLGTLFHSLGDYVKAKEYLEKALAIIIKIGHREGEATACGNLGTVYKSLGNYFKAKECHEKALAINIKIGHREGEAAACGNLGTVYKSLGNYFKAKECHEKALAINIKIDHRKGEAANYENLGVVFHSLGNYVKAKEYLEKALAINVRIGHRAGEATACGNLGSVYSSLSDYVKAKEYQEKALAINMEIGDRAGVARNYRKLAHVYLALRKYRYSKEYLKKALTIITTIGDREEEANLYVYLGDVDRSLGDNFKAKMFFQKALAIATEIGHKQLEAFCYLHLGKAFYSLDEYVTGEEYLKKALSISKDIRHSEAEVECYCYLSLTKLSQEKFQEAHCYLLRSIERCEDMRGFNTDNDEINISVAERNDFPYKKLTELLCATRKANYALYVAELGRARALADLMATQYSAETQISVNPQSWICIENVMTKQTNCTCLYISYYAQEVFLWILKTSGNISFREITVDKNTLYKRLPQPAENVDEFFALLAKSFRSFGILPEEICEDRSLNDIEPAESDFPENERLAALRHAKDEEDPEPSLNLFHEMLINPVSDLLDEPEIIIVPDRNLYRVPFAALLDKKGKYLSENFRIRIIPSLATLKLIQDSPAGYHSQTGALIVGDPDVGDVIYNGRLNRNFVSLPGARKEAEMIGLLLGVSPLLGKEATKQAVLQRIDSVSLIHFAAHGNAERGEIALSPPRSTNEIPQEDDYLLKMSDISNVQLRAKLVVLSCCHSARGQIRAEGAVGIARAFLGSAARSVLVALWALEDSATEQFMSRFYYHLVRGESASDSLHKAMNWMRENGFSKVSEWAPFMLIGDNVTFDFRKTVS